jgi:hypothetical protein
MTTQNQEGYLVPDPNILDIDYDLLRRLYSTKSKTTRKYSTNAKNCSRNKKSYSRNKKNYFMKENNSKASTKNCSRITTT